MINMLNHKFGKLSVIGDAGTNNRGEKLWKCVCDCGNETVVTGYKLRTGHTASCGCIQADNRRKGFHRSHGMSNTRIHNIWLNMNGRCRNKRNKDYGGRGISVCPEWSSNFIAFYEWAIANGYTDKTTIDRIDVNGNYCPENCRWISREAQSLNRTDNHLVEAFGKRQTIKEWADETGIKYDTIERRLNAYGWSTERAVSERPRKG